MQRPPSLRAVRSPLRAIFVVLLALALAVAASLFGLREAPAQTTPGATTHVIDARDDNGPSRWEPANVTVEVGDTVRWEFDQALVAHTLTSDSSNWNLREYRNAGGAPVEYTFTEAGEYSFYCELHGGMAGKITVVPEGSGGGTVPEPEPAPALEKVLVFSKTAGFRHSSIPNGIAAIQQLGTENGFTVDATEDAARFNDANLAQYDAVVWLSTTGDVLNAEQQGAFERYIGNGGGYVGIHAAADTEYDWSWYGQMLGGAYFDSHPQNQNATIKVEDKAHPSTAHLPDDWQRFDEWYNYRQNPRGDVHVLATLDESTYQGGNMGADHPIAWCTEFDGGRSWYTGGGHTEASYAEDDFEKHILGGLRWAGGAADADCGESREAPPGDSDFQQVTLAKGAGVIGEPIGMTVLPDRRVLTTARDGSIYLVTPDAKVSLAGKIPVYSHDEDGLQGIAVSPNFAEDGWVYAYYAPPLNTPGGDAPNDGTGPETFEPYKGYNQLSRFKMAGSTIDLASEQKLLEVETDRGQCCHAGGEIDFDAEGNLYLSTGDDSNPFQSDGYTPIDERLTRNPAFDAQRSSANTNVLSGKLLRIKPDPANASYAIPAGNLFAPGTEKTRPEIYAMGFRNPFRFDVDPQTGDVLLGDYGPDAGGPSPTRGPGGQVEFDLIKEPGNYGWPYCAGNNDAYNDYDFATGQSGAKFDCAAPVNESPRNTGLTQLPAAEPAWIPYDNCSVPEFGCGSESPMGGPTYRFDPNLESDTKFPEFYDGKMFLYEWGRGWIKTTTENADGSPGEIQSFFDSMDLTRPMNLEFGPDGSLYVLDYGGGFFSGDANSGLYRIDYVQGKRAPIAETSATPQSGPAPLEVRFSSDGSRDLDAGDSIAKYEWDFQDDGTVDSTEANPTFTYTNNGDFVARLTVTDTTGKTGTATENITVGNTEPEITIEFPPSGGFFSYGAGTRFKVSVTDPEDGEIDCSRVKVDTALGHNDHTHGDQSFTGCEGTFSIPAAWEDETQKSFYLVNASYTDGGGPGGAAPLTGTQQVILQPKTLQAENYSSQQGTQTVNQGGASGGKRVGYIDAGDFIAFEPINLLNINSVKLRGSSGGSGGNVELRWNAPDGPVLGTINVPNTGGWDNYGDFGPVQLQNVPEGPGTLYMVFSGGFDVDNVTFVGKGVDENGPPTIDSATATPQRGEAPLEVDFASSATDPENGQVSYKWDFGVADTDADTAETQNATYTYTEPGTYTATLTASDASGLKETRTFRINVFAPAAPCVTPESDQFDGTSLDKTRWNAIVREDTAGYRVEGGSLVLPTVRSDLYGGANGAPNLILQQAPEGPWTVTTRMEFNPTANYQKAGLLLYGDDDNYISADLVFAQTKRFEFLRETGGNVRNDGLANDQKEVPAGFPENYWVRMTSDGQTVTASYSTDNQAWTPLGRPASLDGIKDPKIGLFAVRSNEDSDQIDARFDNFELATPSDEFDGTGLQKCRWTNIVRENPEGYRVADGALKINTGNGLDMYGGNTTAQNIVTQKAPAGPWEATTKVDIPFTGKDYEQAGLMVYGNDQNFAKLSFIKVPDGQNIEFIQQKDGSPVDGGAQDRTALLGADVPNTLFLRITSDGTNLRASWSADGETFTSFGRARSLGDIPNPHVGMAAFNGNGSGNEASFDFFGIDSEIPLQATAKAEPTSGTAPLNVAFTGNAVGGGGAVTYAWDFGVPGTEEDKAATKDASYTYTEPGRYTATLTATDAAGTTSASTVDISVTTPCDTPFEAEEGYRMLFDGTAQSLQGWKMSGPGGFEHDGCAIKSVGGLGLYWFTNGGKEFKAPYTLKMEWRKDNDSNSGVFVGFPDPGSDPFNAVREGEEIQIDDSDNPAQTTGAIYLEQAPDEAARASVYNGNDSNGEWQDYEIRVETDRILVFLNGVKINEWVDDDANVDLASGFVGLQNHGFSGDIPDEVYFRNVRIQEAPDPCAGQFTTPDDQFDGTALDKCRWNEIVAEDPTKYSVADGQLTLTTTPGELYGGDNRKSNLILQSPDHADANGDFVLETKVDASRLDGGYSQAGLLVYGNDGNYVKFAPISDAGNSRPSRIELRSEINDQPQAGPDVNNLTAEQAAGPIWLRLTKTGTTYSGEYSFDGQTWTSMAQSVTNPMTAPRFGLYAHGVQQEGDTVSFDYFTVDGADAPPNGAPTANASANPTSGRAPLAVNFTAGASDPDGDQLTYEWDFGVEGAEDDKSTEANPSYTYAEPGTYTATVTVTDGKGGEATDTVEITVEEKPNQVPTVAPSADPASGKAPLEVRFSAGANDPDGRLVTRGPFKTYASGPSLGYGEVAGTGELVRLAEGSEASLNVGGLKPNTDYDVHVHAKPCGEDNGGPHYMFDPNKPGTSDNEIWLPFTSDASGNGQAGTTRPIRAGAEAVSIVIHDMSAQAARVACADLAYAGDDLSYEWDFGDGATSGEPNPTHTYVEPGTYTARVTVTDAGGEEASDTVEVVARPNTPPQASDDAATTDEDIPVAVDVLANDRDVDGDGLSVSQVSDPGHGTATAGANGAIRYVPDENFNGTDTFNYEVYDGDGGTDTATVTVTVRTVNDAPVANDDAGRVARNGSVRIDVLANDSDVDGDELSVADYTKPAQGRVTANPDGTLTYKPNRNFRPSNGPRGTDTFTYTVSDGNGGTDEATVRVEVVPPGRRGGGNQ